MTSEPAVERDIIDVQPGDYYHTLPTKCHMRVYRREGREPVAVVTEMSTNPGLSVTNAALYIWRAIARRLDTTRLTLIVHYDEHSYAGGRRGEVAWDRVVFYDGTQRFEPMTRGDVLELVGAL